MNVSPKRGKMVNGFDPANAGSLSMRSQDFIDRRDRLLVRLPVFYENPVEFSHASGVFMYDSDGNEYLDAYNNVVSVGHCHPHVNAAIAAQMDTLCTHTRYMQDGILDFAEKLLATFEENIGHLMFTCTGSEANDLALRMAKYHTGHEGIIVTSEAYHGNSELTSGFSPSMGENSRLGTWVRRVPAPDTYRVETGDMGEWLAAQVSDQILDLKRRGRGLPHSLPTACSLQMVYFPMNQECLNRSLQWFVRQGAFLWRTKSKVGSLARGHGCGDTNVMV